MGLDDKVGSCLSCGRAVKGKKGFIGPISYHCDEPPPFGCWPHWLWEWDKKWYKEFLKLIKGATMNYTEAKDALLSHKYVTRKNKSWDDELGYLVFLPGLTHFLKVTLVPKANVVPFAANIEDSDAKDWEVVEPANVKLPALESIPEAPKA